MAKRRAIFLDRDGTVIRAVPRPEIGPEMKAWAPWYLNELNFEPNLREAIKIFRSFGYMTIMATNQPDVAYGNITEDRWQEIHNAVLAEVQPDFCCICRHRTKDNCPNKKPAPGMLINAEDFFNINLKESFMIGDTENDMLAGKRADCKTILIERHYNLKNNLAHTCADFVVPSLLAATAIV